MSYRRAKDVEYTELARAKVQPMRSVVISKRENMGDFSLVMMLEVQEGNRTTYVYMKDSSMYVDNIDGLYNLRDALNVAISEAEKSEKEKKSAISTENEWDS